MYKRANSCTPTRFLERVKNSPAACIDYLPAESPQRFSHTERENKKNVRSPLAARLPPAQLGRDYSNMNGDGDGNNLWLG